jgi:hypothetical protein
MNCKVNGFQPRRDTGANPPEFAVKANAASEKGACHGNPSWEKGSSTNGTRLTEFPLESVPVRRKPPGVLLDIHRVIGRLAPFRNLFLVPTGRSPIAGTTRGVLHTVDACRVSPSLRDVTANALDEIARHYKFTKVIRYSSIDFRL